MKKLSSLNVVVRVVLCTLILGLLPGRAIAVNYDYTTIDVPGADRTEAYGINNAGQIVGFFFDATGQHGFLKDGDTYIVIDVNTNFTSALGINDATQIVGFAADQGFIKDGDTIETIVVPDSAFTVPRDINNLGQVVGNFAGLSGNQGFLKDGDNYFPIGAPDAFFTEATGISNDGQIVGNFIGSNGFQPFELSGGVFTVVQVPGATIVEAGGVNQQGQIVGTFLDTNSVAHGFVMTGSDLSALDVPDAALPNFTQAQDINELGQVVGWFSGTDGQTHGFLATPIPSIDTIVVTIDISPGKHRNVINPQSHARIWVAILSDTGPESPFDATSQVDIKTVEFGPGGARPVRHRVHDVNRDRVPDVILQFKIVDTGIACGDEEATLTGETFGGVAIAGIDSIKTMKCR